MLSRYRSYLFLLAALLLALPCAMLFLDIPVALWVHNQPFSEAFKTILRLLRLPGHFGFTLALAAAIVVGVRSSRRSAAALLLAGAIASIVTAILKWSFGRTRPFQGRPAFEWMPFQCSPVQAFQLKNLSFPSGDVTLAFATAAIVSIYFPRLRIIAFGWAILVAVTRVLQGAHYPSDTIGGAMVGVATAILLANMKWAQPSVVPVGRPDIDAAGLATTSLDRSHS